MELKWSVRHGIMLIPQTGEQIVGWNNMVHFIVAHHPLAQIHKTGEDGCDNDKNDESGIP